MTERARARTNINPHPDAKWALCPVKQDQDHCWTNCALYHVERQACSHLVQADEAIQRNKLLGRIVESLDALGAER